MNVTNYSVRPISMDEAQQLLWQNSHPVLLLLCSADPGKEPGLTCNAPEPAVATIADDAKIREQMLADYLHQLGIPAHIRGYKYLKTAIEFSIEKPALLGALTKELYPDIARCCGSTSANVERAIRHAIETAWSRGDLKLQEDLFGTTIDNGRIRPTSGEFIAMVAEKFRFMQPKMTGENGQQPIEAAKSIKI